MPFTPRLPRRAAACFCLLLCLALPARAGADPLASLTEAQRGIDECNSDLFTNNVDIASVVNKAADSLIASLSRQAAEGKLGEGNLAMALALLAATDGSTQGALLKPLLVSEVRGFVAAGINGGYFAGKPNGSVTPSRASLASALDRMAPGRRVIQPGKVLEKEDGKATVSAVFIDPNSGRFPLRLEMEQENGRWRVKEISNAQELVEIAQKRNK